ncbi:BglG family transcription antiterminator [Breznakia pachnodae]|uniref:Lichenan operon transcriptional antiterminator n=1 Tax=Breznakia pachnodae TaxID=265178 RepID=A0ABU0E3P7_9FIRM|nr:PRD domain-containing protein [Breznakia pachnodae]MDQ0361115.1 lichenan operon transcriptional antiterminator [Breznakia pachnodae]
METFNQRFIEIIQLLYHNHSDEYFSAERIASILDISSKTVSRTMQTYSTSKVYDNYGFFLDIKRGNGYLLKIVDGNKFEKFIEKYLIGIETENYKEEREVEIIKILLLNEENYITVQDIADKIYVSEATISLDLKYIKHKLQKFGLCIGNKPAKGIRIEGSEMSKRLCYSKYLFNHKELIANEFEYSNEDIQYIEQTVLDILNIHQIQMSDISRNHLVLHIVISIYRMRSNYFITFENEEAKQIIHTREFVIAKAIVDALKNRFFIADVNEEILYIAIQLLGKKSLSGKSQYLLAKDIEEILVEIFLEIKKKMEIDLQEDVEVFNYLAMHFEPMLTRLKYGIKSNNPLTEDIKVQQATSFEMGLIAKKVILDYYDYDLDDNEVSYLAMYFSLALDKLKYLKKPKNVLVVCGLGVCSSRILLYKIRQQYGDYINDILTCQIHELRQIALSQFDCIVSTVEDPIATDLPVIYIEDFITDLRNEELDEFFLNDKYTKFEIEKYVRKDLFLKANTMKDEEEAISYILQEIKKVYDIPNELKKNILEREKLSSTAFGSYCAIPHPIMMCTEETIFAVLILNKSMMWDKKKVKCIFLLSPSKNSPGDLRYFTDTLAKFIANPQLVAKFSKSQDYNTLKKLLTSVE